MTILRFLATLLLAAAWRIPAVAGSLEDYVARPDASYAWELRRIGVLDDLRWAELRLVSQTWRDTTWRHQLYVIRPANVAAGVRHALLFIDGGRWKPEYEQATPDMELPSRAGIFADLARRLATPVVVLRQVPFQPLFGMKEDDLIAHTFEQYLKTGDADWPLLLPMVKSVVRAMDATQEYAASSWELPIDEFTLTGASKRGWTTWLTAVVDPRVAAIAPMVFDVLNMRAQLEHQEEVWGSLSEQLADYTRRDLHTELSGDASRALREAVDPYGYRERLVQPKLIILATNDPYWPVDALNLYWDDLPPPKYILYVPNAEHGLDERERIVEGLAALHAAAGGSASLPQMEWAFRDDGGVLELSVSVNTEPAAVTAWVATSKSRDFRRARWVAHPTRREDDGYTFQLRPLPRRYGALFAELTFEEPNRLHLSTAVRIVAGSKVPAAHDVAR